MTAYTTLWVPYCGLAPAAEEWRWNLDPAVLSVLAVATVIVGWRLRRHERALGLGALEHFAI